MTRPLGPAALGAFASGGPDHGNYVEWFEEDDAAPLGYRVAHWYGTREACEQRMREPAPPLLPARGGREVDAATASGMYDP